MNHSMVPLPMSSEADVLYVESRSAHGGRKIS